MAAPTSRVLVNASQNSPTLGNNASPFQSHSDLAKAAITNSPSSRLRAGRVMESVHTDVHTNGGADVGDDSRGSFKSWKRGEGLNPWERDLVESSELRRKANVAQLCECDLVRVVRRNLIANRNKTLGRFSQSLL